MIFQIQLSVLCLTIVFETAVPVPEMAPMPAAEVKQYVLEAPRSELKEIDPRRAQFTLMQQVDSIDDHTEHQKVARKVSFRKNQASSEVRASDSFDVLNSSNNGSENSESDLVVPSDSATTKLLGDGTPEWIKKGLTLGEDHNLAINSSFFATVEECEEDLRSRMMTEIHEYLDKNVLSRAKASSLPELTSEYVQKYWVVPAQRYENIRDNQGETLHQLWMGLHISSEQLKKVREWENAGLRQDRTRQVGLVGGLSVAGLTLLSGMVGVFARREKAKLKV
jgi:hypothetical protein